MPPHTRTPRQVGKQDAAAENATGLHGQEAQDLPRHLSFYCTASPAAAAAVAALAKAVGALAADSAEVAGAAGAVRAAFAAGLAAAATITIERVLYLNERAGTVAMGGGQSRMHQRLGLEPGDALVSGHGRGEFIFTSNGHSFPC